MVRSSCYTLYIVILPSVPSLYSQWLFPTSCFPQAVSHKLFPTSCFPQAVSHKLFATSCFPQAVSTKILYPFHVCSPYWHIHLLQLPRFEASNNIRLRTYINGFPFTEHPNLPPLAHVSYFLRFLQQMFFQQNKRVHFITIENKLKNYFGNQIGGPPTRTL